MCVSLCKLQPLRRLSGNRPVLQPPAIHPRKDIFGTGRPRFSTLLFFEQWSEKPTSLVAIGRWPHSRLLFSTDGGRSARPLTSDRLRGTLIPTFQIGCSRQEKPCRSAIAQYGQDGGMRVGNDEKIELTDSLHRAGIAYVMEFAQAETTTIGMQVVSGWTDLIPGQESIASTQAGGGMPGCRHYSLLGNRDRLPSVIDVGVQRRPPMFPGRPSSRQ